MLTIAALVLFAAPQGPVLSRLARPLPGSSSVLVEERVLDAAPGRVLRRASVDGAPVDAAATLRDPKRRDALLTTSIPNITVRRVDPMLQHEEDDRDLPPSEQILEAALRLQARGLLQRRAPGLR